MGPRPPPPFPWSSSSTDCSWCLSDCIMGSNRGLLKCEMKDKVFKGSVQWKNGMSKKQERKQNIARGSRRAILTFFKHREAKTWGDLPENALINFTHLFDKMLFFLWALYPITTIVSYVLYTSSCGLILYDIMWS